MGKKIHLRSQVHYGIHCTNFQVTTNNLTALRINNFIFEFEKQ